MFRVACFVVALSLPGCTDGDAEKLEKIPLDTIYMDTGQDGAKSDVGLHTGYFTEEELRFFQFSLRPGGPNLFVTTGSLPEVLKKSIKFQGLNERAFAPKGTQFWLCVFFGEAQSSPRQWTVVSIERSSNRVRVNYRLPENVQGTTRDSRPYFAWVPLGELNYGKHVFELVNAGTGEATLMRRVEITGK